MDELEKVIRLYIFQTLHNGWDIPLPQNQELIKEMGKICYPLQNMEFWTYWEFFGNILKKSFGLRKDCESLYRLFDILPKQATYEMKALQIQV